MYHSTCLFCEQPRRPQYSCSPRGYHVSALVRRSAPQPRLFDLDSVQLAPAPILLTFGACLGVRPLYPLLASLTILACVGASGIGRNSAQLGGSSGRGGRVYELNGAAGSRMGWLVVDDGCGRHCEVWFVPVIGAWTRRGMLASDLSRMNFDWGRK